MTTITRERLEQALANPTKITFNYGETLELARIALASRDAKPVAWTDEQELRDVDESGIGYLFAVNPITPYADPRRVIKLYTVPPALVVHQEPIAWLNDAYLARGVVDGEAGSEDVGPGYIPVYREPLYAVQPAAVVPDDLAKAFISAIEKEQDRLFGEDYLMDSKDCIDVIREEMQRLNACRAAPLQGSQLVSNRDELSFEQWLSQQNEKIDVDCGCVTTEAFFHWLRVAYESGNSPVIPDGLCPCCGRKPLKHSKCAVSGCGKKHVANGLCQRHYDMKRREDPEQVEKFREANRRFTAKKRAQKAAAPRQEVK